MTARVRDADWYGEDLSGRVWKDTAFVDVDLSETTSTSGLTFDSCSFQRVRFTVSSHAGASFANCTFGDCRFFDSTFTDCKFLGARFERCALDRLVVSGGDWSFVRLAGADLRTARFSDVRMREADLTGADCTGGSLVRVDLAGAALDRAKLDRCDLRGSNLTSLDPWTTTLRGAVIDPVQALTVASALGLEIRDDAEQ